MTATATWIAWLEADLGSVMTGLLELGAFLGAISAGFIADKYSRKRSLGIGAIWFIVGR
jgi:MFS family permease